MGPLKCYEVEKGGGRVSDFPEKNISKMYGSTLLALRGGRWVSNFQKESIP